MDRAVGLLGLAKPVKTARSAKSTLCFKNVMTVLANSLPVCDSKPDLRQFTKKCMVDTGLGQENRADQFKGMAPLLARQACQPCANKLCRPEGLGALGHTK